MVNEYYYYYYVLLFLVLQEHLPENRDKRGGHRVCVILSITGTGSWSYHGKLAITCPTLRPYPMYMFRTCRLTTIWS